MEYTKKFLHIIKSRDILGEPISFTIDKEDAPKTLIGGILSCSVWIFLVVLFILQIRDPVFKTNPTLSSFFNIQAKPEPFDLTLKNLPIAINIMDEKMKSYNDIFSMQAYQTILDVSVSDEQDIYRQLSFDLINCTSENFPFLPKEDFDKLNVDESKCIKNQNLTIEGITGESRQKYVTIQLSYCDYINGMKDPACDINAKKELIKNKTNLFFLMFFQNNIFDPLNYTEPVQNYLESCFIYIDNNSIKSQTVYLSKSLLKSDDDILFSSFDKEYKTISYEYTKSDTYIQNYDENAIAYIMINLSNKEFIYYRTYSKLPSILAEIWGLFEYLKIILKFMFFFTDMKRNVKLMNRIYEFDFERKSNIKNSKKLFYREFSKLPNLINNQNKKEIQTFNQKNKNLQNDYENNEVYEFGVRKIYANRNIDSSKSIVSNLPYNKSNSNLNDDNNLESHDATDKTKKIDEFFKLARQKSLYVMARVREKSNDNKYFNIKKNLKKEKIIRFSNWEIIYLNLCCRRIKNKKLKRKYELYKIGEEKLENMLEIYNLLEKLEEIEKLKVILLNKQQLGLFNFMSSEKISLYSDNLKNSQLNELREFQKNEDKLNIEIEKFRDILNHNEEYLDAVDRRLFNHLPQELKEMMV